MAGTWCCWVGAMLDEQVNDCCVPALCRCVDGLVVFGALHVDGVCARRNELLHGLNVASCRGLNERGRCCVRHGAVLLLV